MNVFQFFKSQRRDFADKLSQESSGRTQRTAVKDSGLTAIFDGKHFVFNESAWTVVNLINMVRRYGISYFRLRSGPRSMLRRFVRLYELQARFPDMPDMCVRSKVWTDTEPTEASLYGVALVQGLCMRLEGEARTA